VIRPGSLVMIWPPLRRRLGVIENVGAGSTSSSKLMEIERVEYG
jgi:hypothetical protein